MKISLTTSADAEASLLASSLTLLVLDARPMAAGDSSEMDVAAGLLCAWFFFTVGYENENLTETCHVHSDWFDNCVDVEQLLHSKVMLALQ